MDKRCLPANIDVLLPKRSGSTAARHELVKGVHTLHVVHDTKRMIVNDIGSALQEIDCLGIELLNLRFAALFTIVFVSGIEVLARKLGDHDGLVEGVVQELDVSDEIIRLGSVEVNGGDIDLSHNVR